MLLQLSLQLSDAIFFFPVQELDLSGCKALTDTGVIAVAESCPQLERLQLASCQGLTDCSFVALGSFCSNLSVLSACGCEQLTDLGLRCLSQGARSAAYLLALAISIAVLSLRPLLWGLRCASITAFSLKP